MRFLEGVTTNLPSKIVCGSVPLPVSTLPVKGPRDPVKTAAPLDSCATGDETATDGEDEGVEPGCNAASTPGKAFPIACAAASVSTSTGSEIAGWGIKWRPSCC